MAKGSLKVQCFSENTYVPVNKARIVVTPTDANGRAMREDIEVYTNSSGLTEIIELDAPPIENSYTPGLIPYSFVNITIDKDGYERIIIKGVQIYPQRVALQRVNFREATSTPSSQTTSGVTGPTAGSITQGTMGGPTMGVTGFTGVGITGSQISSGSTSITGVAGSQMSSGSTSITGPTVPQTQLGSSGVIGTVGGTSSQGFQGTTGVTGPTGTQIFSGATGAQGSTGTQIFSGVTGAQGSTGTQIFSGVTGVQGPTGVQILPAPIGSQVTGALAPTSPQISSGTVTGTTSISRQEIIIEIPANVQLGNYPPKIPEAEEKPLPKPQGVVVLANPVVPQYIRVHAGTPDDNSAPNYTVPYKDYIENVACCEIYSTWPDTTIRANIYSIISFTLNRIYTEWYRGQGKNFDITSSTAYDQAFSYGRNIYENISQIVDEIFSTYIERDGAKQPLLSQFCNGTTVTCSGLSQWGSKYLGDEGYTPYEILTYYYGDNINLLTAPKVLGIPQSYPGYSLSIGSSGSPVRTIQNQLNAIANSFPLIPKLAVDGIYGSGTQNSVKVFQQTFSLPVTGVVDYATWYKISAIYVGVTKIAELRESPAPSTKKRMFIPPIISASEDEIPKVPY